MSMTPKKYNLLKLSGSAMKLIDNVDDGKSQFCSDLRAMIKLQQEALD